MDPTDARDPDTSVAATVARDPETTVARDPETFIAAAGPSLLPIARALTGGQPAAEELVSTVLAMVSRRWHRINSDPMPYAHRLIYREYAGRRGASTPQAWAAITRPSPPAHQLCQAALGQLEPRPRALLVLRYLQRCTDAEAAAFVGSSPGAVAEEFTQALAEVRAQLARAGPSEAPPTASEVEDSIRNALRALADGTALAESARPTGSVGTSRRDGTTWYLRASTTGGLSDLAAVTGHRPLTR